tara:strand:- start:6 stop:371 length:366 start_codon:yes stop_codon:yes gene_type:complete
MKFIPNKTPEQELKDKVDLVKQELKRKQYPSKHAPKVESDLLITISGCSLNFLKQEKGMLVLQANKKLAFENGTNILRALSYIAGVYDHVTIAGWTWRPIRYKKHKLYLRPVAPVDLGRSE